MNEECVLKHQTVEGNIVIFSWGTSKVTKCCLLGGKQERVAKKP